MAMRSPSLKPLKKLSRCPECKSRRVVLARYAGGPQVMECEGCYSVIQERACPVCEGYGELNKQGKPLKKGDEVARTCSACDVGGILQ